MEGAPSSYFISDVFVPVNGEDRYNRVNVLIENDSISKIEVLPLHKDPNQAETTKLNVPETAVRINGKDKMLLPGFVNAHTHSSEMWARGEVDMLPLELWLASLIDYSGFDDPEFIYVSALQNGIECLLSGATTVLDHLSPIPGKMLESVEAAARAYKELGIRAYIAPLIYDLPFDFAISHPVRAERPPIPGATEELLSKMKEIVKLYHSPSEQISIGIGPTGPHLCSDELIKGLVALSNEHDLVRHTHCLESHNQAALFKNSGISAVAKLESLGFLNGKTTCAHTVHVTEDDLKIFKKNKSTMVHNPLSNLRLGSGISPVLTARKEGVNLAVGCDGAASNDSQDMLEAIKLAQILHNVTTREYRDWLTPHQIILEIASQGGAKALGMGDSLGSIEEGKKADLVLVDLVKEMSMLPKTDPLGLFVMGHHSRDIMDKVWVNGRLVVSEGDTLKVKRETGIKLLLEKSSHWRLKKLDTPLRNEIEANYRKGLGLPV